MDAPHQSPDGDSAERNAFGCSPARCHPPAPGSNAKGEDSAQPTWFRSPHTGYGRHWRGRGVGAPHGSRQWRRKRRFLFGRFVRVFIAISLFIGSWMALLAFLVTRLVGGDGQTVLLLWIAGCGLLFALPIVGLVVGVRVFRNVVGPLADVMTAADAVADGDLSVRVPENSNGEMGRLARSFNRMTAELDRSDQQRRNLTADIAHELRTPLHVIQGNLEGILDGVYDPTPAHIHATLEETRRLARLVDDLRTLAQAEAGQLPLMLEPVDLHELLADVDTSFRVQAEAAGIELTVAVTSAAPASLHADVGRLYQVLANLVMNALRHTPVGGTVTVHAAPAPEGICIAVSDTGQGIAADELPYIFDRFWRGDRARTHVGGAGSGLGLAIARQLVRAHGGRIDVESTPGRGTTFRIELPVEKRLRIQD